MKCGYEEWVDKYERSAYIVTVWENGKFLFEIRTPEIRTARHTYSEAKEIMNMGGFRKLVKREHYKAD